MKKFQITIWNPHPHSNNVLYNKTEANTIILRILEKEIPYSFEVHKYGDDGWKTLVYSHYTENEFYKK